MEPLSREERLLNLLAAMLAARSPLPFSEICGKVAGYDDPASADALEKRFDRDKADLRGLGVPLLYVPDDETGQPGYRVERERFFLDEIRFTFEEGIVLAALQRGAAAAGGGPMEESLRSALAKIGVDSPLSSAFRESVADQQVLDPRVRPDPDESPETLGLIAEALAARSPVRFRYWAINTGDERDRTVEPFGIGYLRGNWYLVGRDTGKDAVRSFRTDRIRGEVTRTGAGTYSIPEDFNLRERVGVAPWEMKTGPEITARIRFEPDVAWMIRENLRAGQEWADEEGGAGVLTLAATDASALVRWIAEYGPLAEVLEPPALRERMGAHFRKILEEMER